LRVSHSAVSVSLLTCGEQTLTGSDTVLMLKR